MEAHRIKDEDNFSGVSTKSLPAEDQFTSVSNTEDTPLVRHLQNSPAVKEFAIFNDGNSIDYLSSDPSSLAKMDPAYYLSASLPVGGIINDSKLNYLLFTTGQNQRYMIFQWNDQRVILALRSTGRPGQLYEELAALCNDGTKPNFRRGANATTH